MADLVVETGAGLSTANAYATVAQGDAFALDHLYATPWTGATSDNKRRALIQGTRLLDEQVVWAGIVATSVQALQWPRIGVYKRDGLYLWAQNVVPDPVAKAAWLLAMGMLAENLAEEPLRGFSSITAGPIRLEIDKTNYAQIIQREVESVVYPALGTIAGRGLTVRLVRT